MKIEVGKTYKSRGGGIAKVEGVTYEDMEYSLKKYENFYGILDGHGIVHWNKNGKYLETIDSSLDLIEEVK